MSRPKNNVLKGKSVSLPVQIYSTWDAFSENLYSSDLDGNLESGELTFPT